MMKLKYQVWVTWNSHFLNVCLESGLPQAGQHFLHLVLFFVVGVYEDVVKVNADIVVEQVKEEVVHVALEGSRAIREPKWKDAD
ncbi:hypothetical protein DTO021D3_2909 [Paecilomyces variotii]|nr:hypothetical protein DTO021D3_2909 [Paecilomyces variotii]KAJ9343135.1 hypothetical protein DTO027B6_4410 [Paecilomyces variotii]